MKKHATVSSADIRMPLVVQGSASFVDETLTHPFWDKYVIGDVATTPGITDDALVTVNESDTLTYDIQSGTIACDTAHIPSGIKFAAHILERERQSHSTYMIHGDVVSLEERAVACVGGISGIGKTSLAVAASIRGWEWASDEKFLMRDGLYVQGLSTILDDDKTREAAGNHRPTSSRTARQLAAFVIPIATPGELTVHKYDTAKTVYHLYEEMGRNITASRAIMLDYTPLPSVDTPEIAEKRYACAAHLAETVPMYFMMGPVEAILAKLEHVLSL